MQRRSILLSATIIAAGGPWRRVAGTPPPGLDTMRTLAADLLAAGRYDDAIAAYREIVEHTPRDPRSHRELASALAFLRRWPEAVRPLEAARKLDPENREVLAIAAIVYAQLGRVDDAYTVTRASAELGDTTAMYELAGMYERGSGVARDLDAAVRWIERAAWRGYLGAMRELERIYREGRHGRDPDPARADLWAARRRDAQ